MLDGGCPNATIAELLNFMPNTFLMAKVGKKSKMEKRIRVRRLRPEESTHYRALRLQGLQLHPQAYGSSFEEEAPISDNVFGKRLANETIFGAWSEGALVGCAGLVQREKLKLQHKAILWGMFVLPEARRCGVGKRLLEEILAHARTCCEEVLLTVVEGNEAASALYTDAGFEQYGREPDTIRIGDEYYHEVLMRLPLKPKKQTVI